MKERLLKRIVCGAHDALAHVAIAAILIAGFASPAYAYVDPSVMTYTIQALAGVAVAIGAVAGVAFRRSRKWLFKALNIDENANKEVETDVVRCSADEAPDSESEPPRSAETSETQKTRKMSRGAKAVLAIIAAVAFSFTLLFAAPVELIGANLGDFVFSFSELLAPVVALAAVVAVALALVLFLLPDNAFRIATGIVIFLAIGFYVEAMFLNNGLPIADGSPVNWFEYKTVTAISLIVWAAIAAAVILLYKRIPRGAIRCLAAVGIALVLVQAVGLVSIFAEHANDVANRDEEVYVTGKGIFDLSQKSNVLVFVLDTYDTAFLDAALEVDPDLLSEFTGFTYYHNSTGSMAPSRYGVPFLLTGKVVSDFDNYNEYFDGRYATSHFIDDIYDAGYSIGIYTNEIWDGVTHTLDEKTINIRTLADSSLDFWPAAFEFAKTALYRDMPWILKWSFRYSTDELNDTMVQRLDKTDISNIPFTANNLDFYENLQARTLSTSDDGRAGAFRLVHLAGVHWPYSLSPDATEDVNATREDQCRGLITIMNEYLRQMKELGIYDQSTIIVTADHGIWRGTGTVITAPTSPVFLVKEAGADSTAPIVVSDVPTGHVDYPATIIEAIGGDYTAYGTPAGQVGDGERTRYYFMSLYDSGVIAFVEFAIDGDVNDWDDWALTGRSYDVDESSVRWW